MGRTFLTGGQVKDGSVQKVDLDTTTTGQAVITKVIAGTNINISSTGVDAGTGDVTVNLGGTVASDISSLQSSVSGKADSSSLATVATSGSYTDLSNKPSLFSGSYTDLTSKPTLFDGAYSSLTGAPTLATVATSGSYADLTGKPSLFSGSYTDLTNKPSLFDGAYSSLTGTPSLATVATSGSYADLSNKPTLGSFTTLTSPASGQFLKYNGTAWINSAVAYSDVTGTPSLATVATSGSYNDLTNKPAAGASDLDGLSDVVITSAAKGQFITHNGTNFVNSRTLEADAAATTPLTIKGAASQSAYLLSVTDSANTVLAAITPSSRLRLGTSAVLYSELGYNSADASMRVTSINDNCFSIASPDNGSGVYTLTISRNTTRNTWEFSRGATNAIGYNFNTYAAAGGGLGVNLSTAPGAELHVNSNAAAKKGCIIRGAASQTANLFEVQNSAGTALFAIRSDGTETLTTSGSNVGIQITHNTSGQACLGLTHNSAGTGTQYYAAFYNATPALVGSITTNGSGTTYTTTSDYRLKENVVPMADGLSRLIELPVYRFNYKERPQEIVDGCLAHEVSSVVPEAVIGEKDAVDPSGRVIPQGVDYSKLVPLLVAAIKELKQKNDELESRLLTLENK